MSEPIKPPMSRSSRRVALALAATTALSIVGAACLIGGLGGNWLAFLALAAVLCVLCVIAFVLLAFGGAAMVSADDPTGEDEAEGNAIGQALLIGESRIEDDRERWQP